MATTLENKKERRLGFLRTFYEKVDGKEGYRLAPMQYFEIAGSLNIPQEEVGEIIKYWIGEGVLARKPASEALSFTHKGIVLVEEFMATERRPNHPEQTPPRASGKVAHTAFVLNVLIASPSDVNEERDAVTGVIHEWNAVQYATTGILLRPIRWETHSFPASGDRPQAILNKQIVDDADFVIAFLDTGSARPVAGAIRYH